MVLPTKPKSIMHRQTSSSSSNGVTSVLSGKFSLASKIESRISKAFADTSRSEIHTLATCLIRFLELKVVLQEYSSNPSSHLLAATPLVEQAWLALYGDVELYPQLIVAIQKFHGQAHSHVYLRRSCLPRENDEESAFSTLSSDQEYLAKLARTQSLMQCYYQTTMPSTLRELSRQSSNKITKMIQKTSKKALKKSSAASIEAVAEPEKHVSFTAVPLQPTLTQEEEQEEEEEQEYKPDDLPSVVIPENDSLSSASDYSDYDDDDFTDTITHTSSLTNSTALNPSTNVCGLMFQSCLGTVPEKQHDDITDVPDDLTMSVTSSERSDESSGKKNKRPYQKIAKRWDEMFPKSWQDFKCVMWA